MTGRAHFLGEGSQMEITFEQDIAKCCLILSLPRFDLEDTDLICLT